ncbi:EAL domain-containing protein [Companilactobacillus paralimentarius]|uniref:EAL domain-containing protein n=1 Tax=Companilactobacillus paralimentarius TaxID=83526 RepID=UPI00384CB9F8
MFGYEVLLRKEDNGSWHLPKDFTELSIEQQTKLLEETVKSLKKNTGKDNRVISFNLNHDQTNDPSAIDEIISLKKRIAPVSLTIELTEAVPLNKVKELSSLLHQNNISLVLDDVGTGSNTYENIKQALPYVDRIKFAMQNFRMNGHAELIPKCLDFWVKQAKQYCLDMVIEGVEDYKDQVLAKNYGIFNRDTFMANPQWFNYVKK